MSFDKDPVQQGPKEQAQAMLGELATHFQVDASLTGKDRDVAIFEAAYANMDKGVGAAYRKRQALAGYSEYSRTNVLPGYVLRAHTGILSALPKVRVPPVVSGDVSQLQNIMGRMGAAEESLKDLDSDLPRSDKSQKE